jgi:hypothetical protein
MSLLAKRNFASRVYTLGGTRFQGRTSEELAELDGVPASEQIWSGDPPKRLHTKQYVHKNVAVARQCRPVICYKVPSSDYICKIQGSNDLTTDADLLPCNAPTLGDSSEYEHLRTIMISVHSLMKAVAATLGERVLMGYPHLIFHGHGPRGELFYVIFSDSEIQLHVPSVDRANGQLMVELYAHDNNSLLVRGGTVPQAVQILHGYMDDAKWIEGALRFGFVGRIPARFGFRVRDLDVRRRSRSARRSPEVPSVRMRGMSRDERHARETLASQEEERRRHPRENLGKF